MQYGRQAGPSAALVRPRMWWEARTRPWTGLGQEGPVTVELSLHAEDLHLPVEEVVATRHARAHFNVRRDSLLLDLYLSVLFRRICVNTHLVHLLALLAMA